MSLYSFVASHVWSTCGVYGKWDSLGLFASVLGDVQEDVDEVIDEAVCPSCHSSGNVNGHVLGPGNGLGGRELDWDGCD
jgi:hypothetical protein